MNKCKSIIAPLTPLILQLLETSQAFCTSPSKWGLCWQLLILVPTQIFFLMCLRLPAHIGLRTDSDNTHVVGIAGDGIVTYPYSWCVNDAAETLGYMCEEIGLLGIAMMNLLPLRPARPLRSVAMTSRLRQDILYQICMATTWTVTIAHLHWRI